MKISCQTSKQLKMWVLSCEASGARELKYKAISNENAVKNLIVTCHISLYYNIVRTITVHIYMFTSKYDFWAIQLNISGLTYWSKLCFSQGSWVQNNKWCNWLNKLLSIMWGKHAHVQFRFFNSIAAWAICCNNTRFVSHVHKQLNARWNVFD